MKPDQQMQAIVEASGGCWHEVSDDQRVFNAKDGSPWFIRYCVHCGQSWDKVMRLNPSPTDLNAIAGLARKLGIDYNIHQRFDSVWACVFDGKQEHSFTTDNPADALREALYLAVKGEK